MIELSFVRVENLAGLVEVSNIPALRWYFPWGHHEDEVIEFRGKTAMRSSAVEISKIVDEADVGQESWMKRHLPPRFFHDGHQEIMLYRGYNPGIANIPVHLETVTREDGIDWFRVVEDVYKYRRARGATALRMTKSGPWSAVSMSVGKRRLRVSAYDLGKNDDLHVSVRERLAALHKTHYS